MRRLVAIVLCAVAVGAPARADAATLQAATVAAWNAYVAATEARIARELSSGGRSFLASDLASGGSERSLILSGQIPVSSMATCDAKGRELDVPDGLASHWQGAVFVPGVTLDRLLERLQHPDESGAHQEDVLLLRVLHRAPSTMTVAIRMTRKKIVTVTYDTEHQVDFRRLGPTRATSRSVATRIVEVANPGTSQEFVKSPGDDRGFLWRLNSYWRYEQVTGGVIVELESLTLSRSIPLGMGVVVAPIIDRIARESMTRTLANLRATHAVAPYRPSR